MPRTPDPRTTDFSNQILDFIIQFKRAHDGLSPTLRQIGEWAGIDSVSHVSWYLDRLARDGKIKILGHKTRGIMVTNGHWSVDV